MSSIFIWGTALINFIMGANIMYCFDHVEVGLWRVPLLFIATMMLNLMAAFGIAITKS